MMVLKGLVGALSQWVVIATALILPAGLFAGDWGWLRGWQYLAVYAVMLFPASIVLALFAPASLEARMRPPASAAQPRDDKIASAVLFSTLVLYILFLPLDALVWQLLGAPSALVSTIGLAVSVAGYVFTSWTVFANSFAIPIVEDQTDTGQVLVDSGPYAVVRHPMYLGMVLLFAGMGLWLGSLASLPLAVLLIAAFALRIRAEEKTLVATLPGYESFQNRRRYRLIPFIW